MSEDVKDILGMGTPKEGNATKLEDIMSPRKKKVKEKEKKRRSQRE